MKVFMIGGTGLLGSEAAKELIARGHEVSSIALPPLPTGAVLPPEMTLEFGNYSKRYKQLHLQIQGIRLYFLAGRRERSLCLRESIRQMLPNCLPKDSR